MDFKFKDPNKYLKYINYKSSPSRVLSDLFWLKLPWKKIKDELGEVNILDTGCGRGNYGRKLVNYSNNNMSSYFGIDIYEDGNWVKLEENYSIIKFQKYNGKQIIDHIPKGTNFFMSQSAIEHIKDDLLYFSNIREYIHRSKKNIIQIHLFPSRSCIYLYGYHGLRIYTLRRISKITRMFKNHSYAVLFKLGGDACKSLHYEYITKPIAEMNGDLREIKHKEYKEFLLKVIKRDMKHPIKDPNFYALIIHSNWKKKLF